MWMLSVVRSSHLFKQKLVMAFFLLGNSLVILRDKVRLSLGPGLAWF